MSWYKKILIEKIKEVISSSLFPFVFALVVMLWYYVNGNKFEWVEINPISMPDIPSRLFYSALTYWTLGRYLYKIYFYKILSVIFGQILRNWKLYRAIKDGVWKFLLFLMFFYVVPKTVDLLNAIISVLYNFLGFIIYLFPPLGITLILFIVAIYFLKKSNLKLEYKL